MTSTRISVKKKHSAFQPSTRHTIYGGATQQMSPDEHKQKIYVNDINGQEKEIPQLESNQPQKLLGVMKCPIGDQQPEIS
jgi:hypothetical protein